MATYRAEIEVIAKGLQGVGNLTSAVDKLNKAVVTANKSGGVAGTGKGGRAGRMAAESINALTNATNKRFALMRKINRLEEQGVNVARLRQKIASLTTAQQQRRFGTFNQEFQQLNRAVKLEQDKLRTLQEQTREIDRQARVRGPASPIGGTATMAGSPAAIARSARMGGPSSPIGGTVTMAGSPAARQARNLRARDIATGAGFPLLFGGGPLQAAAGGIGGALGGLGGSIAASAAVAQLEAFVQETAKVGQALGSVSGTLDLMSEKALFTDEKTKLLAESMLKQGDAAGAARVLTEELARKIGQSGIKRLKDFGEETKKLGQLVAAITLRFQVFLAKALQPLLEFLNKAVGELDTRQRFAQLREDLTGERRTAFEARERELGIKRTSRGVRGLEGASGLAKIETLLKEFPLESVQVTGGQIAPSAGDLAAAADSKKRDPVPGLEIEVRLQERLFALNRQIAKAVADKNTANQLALRIEVEQEKLAAKIDQINLKDISQKAKGLEILLAQVDANGRIADLRERQAAADRQLTDKAEDTLQGLKNEGALLQARLDGRLEEEEISQRVNQLTKDNPKLEKDKVQAILEGNAALKKQVELQTKMDQVYERIGASIKSGVVDGLKSAIDGTKSLGEAAANVLQDMSNKLLDIGLNLALFGVSGGGGLFGGFFADGGRPPVGKASIVGEKGPELFVPGTAGTIVPNSALGGGTANIVVNVDASGTNVGGDQDEAKRLGQAVAVAVQQELVRQKRPGGLLA